MIKSTRFRWGGQLAKMEEGRSSFKILKYKPIEKRHLGRPRRRWKDNIRMDLKEIAVNTKNWLNLAQDRDYWRAFLNVTLNVRIP